MRDNKMKRYIFIFIIPFLGGEFLFGGISKKKKKEYEN
jgi:hypothetical protein